MLYGKYSIGQAHVITFDQLLLLNMLIDGSCFMLVSSCVCTCLV